MSVVACSSPAGPLATTPSPTTSTATSTTASPTTSLTDTPSAEWTIVLPLAEVVRWEDSGLSLETDRIAFADAGAWAEAGVTWVKAGAQAGAGLGVTIRNETGHDITWGLDFLATLQIGSHQASAIPFGSPRRTGDSLLRGTVQEGQLVWLFPVSVEELAALGRGRLVARGAFDPQTYEWRTSDLDVEFAWEPP